MVVERPTGEAISRETRYYPSSLPGDATVVGAAVRRHWGIENRLRLLLDIAFREDESRVRHSNFSQAKADRPPLTAPSENPRDARPLR